MQEQNCRDQTPGPNTLTVCRTRGRLTQHVQGPDGVGLQCLDGVVHVVGRRRRRGQVVDLVHCGGWQEAKYTCYFQGKHWKTLTSQNWTM